MALGALKTAVDAPMPWYLAEATFWAYATTCIASTILVGMLLLAGALLVRSGGPERVRHSPAPSNPGRTQGAPAGGPDQDMEQLLESLEQAARGGKTRVAALATVQEQVEVSPAPGLNEPENLRLTRARRVRLALVGPSITAVLFGGVSAAFLPGASGYLQANYTMNTFLILTFAYGWGGLVAYAVASLFLASVES